MVIALRIWVAIMGTYVFIMAWTPGEFRWGKRGKGPVMPKWFGRIWFTAIGLLLLLTAIFYHSK